MQSYRSSREVKDSQRSKETQGMRECWERDPQNHRMVWMGRDLKGQPGTTPTIPGCSKLQPRLGHFQGSWGSHSISGNLSQGLSTFTGGINSFLTTDLNLSSFSLEHHWNVIPHPIQKKLLAADPIGTGTQFQRAEGATKPFSWRGFLLQKTLMGLKSHWSPK